MSEHPTQTQAAPELPPPFNPDPDLIDNLEGNNFERKAYRREAEELRKDAQEGPSR